MIITYNTVSYVVYLRIGVLWLSFDNVSQIRAGVMASKGRGTEFDNVYECALLYDW